MGKSLLIIGEPGTGKTRAALNLDPKETVIVSPNNKELPFKGGSAKFSAEKQNFFKIENFEGVKKVIEGVNGKMPHVKCIIIED